MKDLKLGNLTIGVVEKKARNMPGGRGGGRIVDDSDDDSDNGEGLGIDDALRRAIAQRMLVSTTPTKLPSRETCYDYRIVDDGPRLIPPWEVTESQYTYEVTEDMGYGRDNDEQIPDLMPAETDVAICDDHEYNVDNIIINSYEEKNETNDNTTTRGACSSSCSHASTAKSVTFRTKDEVHSFDRQSETLRNVDEEFFDVARHLMDGDVTKTETNEEGQTKRNHHHSCGNSVLSLFFGCGNGGETNDLSPKPYYVSDGMSSKLYPTADSTIAKADKLVTDKLVTDFMSALKFRLDNMGDRNDDVSTRIKEIAQRIDVYGLPKTYTKAPMIPSSTIRRKEEFAANKSQSIWKNGNTKDEAGNAVKRVPRSFAILPVDNDDDDDDDENDQGLTNRLYHSKEASSDQTKALSTSSVCTPTSLLGWTKKSVIPFVHSPTSQTRLEQIKSEIQKAQVMFVETLNKKVQLACRQRMIMLTNEERLLQIVQERHKIQTMADTTHDESVKVACRERLTRLMIELQSLQVTARAVKVESKKNTQCENPTDWYDQVLNYVGAMDVMTQQDETIAYHHDGEWRRSEENQYSLPTDQCQYDMRSHECANVNSDHDNQWVHSLRNKISRDHLREDGRKWTQPRIAVPVVAHAVQSRTPPFEWL